MKSDFAPYEIAINLDQLDFNEPCFGWYDCGFLRVGNVEPKHIQSLDEFLAPLNQQVFRWLREKHNIQCHIQYHKSDHIWYSFHITFEVLATGENPPVYVKHYTDSWLGLNIEYKTYEEAEIACLHRCISILNNK
jgi:hypothetical protein